MSLDRFHFLCRRIHHSLISGESTESAINQATRHPHANLFGGNLRPGSIPAQIINDLQSLTDTAAAISVAEIYASLDFSSILKPPRQLKRVLAYLVFLAVVFLLFSLAYKTVVAPNFFSMYEIFEMDAPGYVSWYYEHWGTLIIGVVFVLVVTILITLSVFKLFSFAANDNSLGYRYLLPASIKLCYQNLIEVIYFPLENIQNPRHNQSELSDYLREVSHSDIGLKTEIEALLASEGKRLTRLCEIYLQIVSAVVSVLLVLVIFFFLVSAYSPLFLLGEVV